MSPINMNIKLHQWFFFSCRYCPMVSSSLVNKIMYMYKHSTSPCVELSPLELRNMNIYTLCLSLWSSFKFCKLLRGKCTYKLCGQNDGQTEGRGIIMKMLNIKFEIIGIMSYFQSWTCTDYS